MLTSLASITFPSPSTLAVTSLGNTTSSEFSVFLCSKDSSLGANCSLFDEVVASVFSLLSDSVFAVDSTFSSFALFVVFSSVNVDGLSLVEFSSNASFEVVSVSVFLLSVGFVVGSDVNSGVFSFVSFFS